jgi:hypothetical protein
MSTYYYFACEKCREYGGFYSRQMWGNFDILATFRFLAHHTSECGPESLRVVSEHDDRTWDGSWARVVPADVDEGLDPGERYDDFDPALWPRSNDWSEEAQRAYRDAVKRQRAKEK